MLQDSAPSVTDNAPKGIFRGLNGAQREARPSSMSSIKRRAVLSKGRIGCFFSDSLSLLFSQEVTSGQCEDTPESKHPFHWLFPFLTSQKLLWRHKWGNWVLSISKKNLLQWYINSISNPKTKRPTEEGRGVCGGGSYSSLFWILCSSRADEALGRVADRGQSRAEEKVEWK